MATLRKKSAWFWRNVLLGDGLYACVIVSAIALFALTYFFNFLVLAPLLFLVFPFLLVFRASSKTLLSYVPVIVGLNFLVAIFALSFISLLHLKVSVGSLLVVTVFEIILALFVNARRGRMAELTVLKSLNNRAMLFIYVLFFLAFTSRVASVIHAPVPILHDPEAHAYWAKMIVETGRIEFFYSPGLHVWTALLNETTGLSLARGINLITNTLSAFAVLYWGLGVYIISKNKKLALFTSFFVLIAPLPAYLYFEAGKNAFIVAATFLALLLPLTYIHIKKQTILSSICLFLGLTGLALLHYPTFAFGAGYVVLAILFTSVNTLGMRKLPFLTKQLLIRAMPLILSLIFVGFFMHVTGKYEVRSSAITAQTATSFYSTNGHTETVDARTLEAQKKNSSKPTIHNPIKAIADQGKGIVAFVSSSAHTQGILLLGVILAAIYYLCNLMVQQKSWTSFYRISLFSFLLAWLLIIAALSVVKIGALSTTLDTGLLLTFTLGALLLGLLFEKLSNLNYILIGVLLLILSPYFGLKTYHKYQQSSASSFVDQQDLAAYDWINKNLSKPYGFVGYSQINPQRPNIVYPTDGSLWLPVFTDASVSTAFQNTEFTSVKSHINHEYMTHFQSDSKVIRAAAVNYFLGHNYRFIYVDGPAMYQALNITHLENDGLAKIIYSNSTVKVIELL